MSKHPPQWIPIDKPVNYTSHDIVAIARKALNMKKIGHSGTLDPDATGVLVLAIGKATRLISYLKKDKAYQAIIRLGQQTDTFDASGNVTEELDVPQLSQKDIENHLKAFGGDLMQLPPMVSAISYKGKRLYQLAREGVKEVPVPPRPVTIYKLELVDINLPFITVDIECSGGTYIRSLASDLGKNIGCGAHLSSLKRTLSNGFTLKDCISLEELKQHISPRFIVDYPLKGVLNKIELTDQEVQSACHGQFLNYSGPTDECITLYDKNQNMIGLGQYRQDYLKPKIIL